MSANEFDDIARLFLPLTAGAPEALGLADDAAMIPARPGFDLVITKDAIVSGVHALADTSPADLARKLVRVNLSDLAAKGADPDAVFLAVAWPRGWDAADRAAFASGLGEDLVRYGVRLLGGDTVVTPGPFTASLTALGYAPAGRMVRRKGAIPGDRVLVSGVVGDGFLGLAAARGDDGFPALDRAALDRAYRLPEPQVALIPVLRQFATSAADVSDGLLADLGHIASASKVGLRVSLERTPLSPAARRWLDAQPDQSAALVSLATGGDDYQIIATASPRQAEQMLEAARQAGVRMTDIGEVVDGEGVVTLLEGRVLSVDRAGWSHL